QAHAQHGQVEEHRSALDRQACWPSALLASSRAAGGSVMNDAVELWNDFVERGVDDSAVLLESVGKLITEELGRDALPEMSYIAFSLAAQALLLGAETLGRLSAAVERCLQQLYQGEVDPGQALPL